MLGGIRLEYTDRPELVLQFYDKLLEDDSSNAVGPVFCTSSTGNIEHVLCQAVWRRKASLLRRQGKVDQAIQELSTMLDTFYTEVEGWLELADMYTSCQQYAAISAFTTSALCPQLNTQIHICAAVLVTRITSCASKSFPFLSICRDSLSGERPSLSTQDVSPSCRHDR